MLQRNLMLSDLREMLKSGHNFGQNIWRLLHFLTQFVFTTSKMKLKEHVRVAERLKT